MNNETGSKWWAFSENGRLVVACEFETIDAARRAAAQWNKGERRATHRVAVLMNGPTAMGSTRVTTVA